jgi:hypothetical protein
MEIPASSLISIQQRYSNSRVAGKAAEQAEEKGPLKKIQSSESADTESKDENQSPAEVKSTQELSQEERRQVAELAQRDREVRAHEAAHKSAAGQYARGGASFEYQRGPDGKRYAVGGEVSIDVSSPADPREALQKAQLVQRAALAPAQPSSQDRAIAAQAAQQAAQARIDSQQQKAEESHGEDKQEQQPEAIQKYAQNGPDGAKEPENLLDLIA